MTGAVVEVKVDDAEIRAAFNSLVSALTPEGMYPVLNSIGAAIASSTILRFREQQNPDGNAWIHSIRARTTGGQTLVDTGRLRGSITHQVRGMNVFVGTNVVYAATHQYGRGKIPQRSFLGINEDDKDTILSILRRHING